MLHNKCKGIIKTMLLKGVTTMTERKTLRVTGKGNIKVKPDMTRLTITLSRCYNEYDEAIHMSSVFTDALKDLLSPFGFERSDLKTLSFNVDTEYESYKENGAYKQRLVGYSFTHIIKLEFESNNERLGRILFALAHSKLDPKFKISYTIKDKEKSKNELLENAVKDAMEKVKVLAKASDVCLKDILSIDYSWGEIDFIVNSSIEPMCYGMAPSDS